MAKVYAEIIGLEQVHEVLEKLPKKLNKKLLNQACVRASKPIREAAKWNVRQYSDTVYRQVKTWAMKKTPRAGVWVGWKLPGKVAGTRAERAWQAMGGYWLEYGASGGGRTGWRRGKIYRRIPATGWFRRAVDQNVRTVKKDFTKEVQYVINRFLDKAITKHGW